MISGNLIRSKEQSTIYSYHKSNYPFLAKKSGNCPPSQEHLKKKIVQTKKRNLQLISLLLGIGRQTPMVNIYRFPSFLKQTFIRSLMASLLAVMGVVGGTIPEFSRHPLQLSFGFSAYTQDFNEAQIEKYAKAVLEIETLRQTAYQQIQEIIGRNPPNIICNKPNSFKELPRDAQKIAVNYCNKSKSIVQNSGLTVRQFNDLTNRVRSDQALKRRVHNAMIRIQRQQR
ncbi:MAG: DUF4168 domain-containing protein [Microcystaceae cyanobacterium]